MIIFISFALAYLVVYRTTDIKDILNIVINSAVFGILVGYWLSRRVSKKKDQEIKKQMVDNLAQEVSSNRFKCQAIINGSSLTYLEMFVWDNFRVSKYFKILWEEKELTNKLYNLYLLIAEANYQINLYQVASHGFILNPDEKKKKVFANAGKGLKDFAKNTLLEYLEKMESRIGELRTAIQKK